MFLAMGKSKSALPDLGKVIELKPDFTSVSFSFYISQATRRAAQYVRNTSHITQDGEEKSPNYFQSIFLIKFLFLYTFFILAIMVFVHMQQDVLHHPSVK